MAPPPCRRFVALCITLLLVACGGGGGGGNGQSPSPDPDPTTGDVSLQRSVQVGGRAHSYLLYVPGSAIDAGSVPLVLSLHGGGTDAPNHDRFTRLRTTAAARGFALLTPNGSFQSWNAGTCCAPSTTLGIDHVAVISAMLDDAEALFPVDENRVFATGHSNGGMMVYRLACELSERIAAIAPNAAVMMNRDLDASPPAEVFACQPTRPVPVLHIHGLADRCAPYEGGVSAGSAGGTRAPASDSIGFWSDNNRCALAPLLPVYVNGDARCEVHSLCQDNATVRLCTIEGAGHIWPGNGDSPAANDVCGGTGSDDLDANEAIWTFFSNHPRN